jgi:hypothetical protein
MPFKPEGLVLEDEIAIREERLINLAKAKAVLESRSIERAMRQKRPSTQPNRVNARKKCANGTANPKDAL